MLEIICGWIACWIACRSCRGLTSRGTNRNYVEVDEKSIDKLKVSGLIGPDEECVLVKNHVGPTGAGGICTGPTGDCWFW